MAYAGPTFFTDNAKALEIKETANAHFRNKEYQKALDLYSSIINQYDDRVMLDTISIARCNRAACYLNLGEYQRCIDDCNISLLFVSPTPGVADKARFRLAKATKALDDIDEEKRAVDPTYQGRPKYDVDERMREQMRESSANSAKFQTADVEEHRPFGYVVRMKDHDPEYVHMRDMVPASLMSEPRRGEEARRDAFVKRIVATHEPELMQKHPWKCFGCGKPATAWLHSPVADLASFYPIIKDYAQPICEKGGNCAKVTRAAMDKADKEDPEIAREDGVRIKM
ncbi:hypothetical protein DFH07DRAFT_817479 [Mycena maculata]|uniref:Uncharacterized protein n=1 Tax=Mycena maculata TaxID=230809 RepID=A0AAD7J8A8_9AGAR|nr:hypothetical protein DFH07DRAFT_817479 [Mycena maculata]